MKALCECASRKASKKQVRDDAWGVLDGIVTSSGERETKASLVKTPKERTSR